MGGLDSKESACNMGNPGSIPGSGRSPGEENGNPLQYFCLENSMDRGVWWVQAMGSRRVGTLWFLGTEIRLWLVFGYSCQIKYRTPS